MVATITILSKEMSSTPCLRLQNTLEHGRTPMLFGNEEWEKPPLPPNHMTKRAKKLILDGINEEPNGWYGFRS